MSQYISCFGKNAEYWLNDKTVPSGATKHNAVYLREYKDIFEEYKKFNAMIYFMIVQMKIDTVRPMLRSSLATKGYVYKVVSDLKRRKLETKYVEYLKADAEKLRQRLKTMGNIIKENLYLTEWYPYFEEKGFECLGEFNNDGTTFEQLQPIISDFEQWKLDNPDVLAKHIEESAYRKEVHDAHVKRIAEMKKAEKQARREAKKLADAEVKEIKENNRKHMAEYHKVERSFRRYYEGKY